MKTILVTGSNGLLGSACLRRLRSEYDVFASAATNLINTEACEELISRLKPNIVINCAAKVGGVGANRQFPVEFIEDNLAIQTNVIRASARYNVEKLIMIGTSCLYPKHAPIPVNEDSLLTGPFEPDVEAYAIAKLSALALCRAYNAEYGRRFITVCPSNLFGLNDNYGPSAHVIPALIRRAKEAHDQKKPLVVWGDGNQVREFLYADDCADAIAKLLENDMGYDLVNIGTRLGTNIRTLVDTIKDVANLDIEVKYDTSKPIGIHSKTFDCERIWKTGWRAETSLSEGLLKTWVDFIESPNPRNK